MIPNIMSLFIAKVENKKISASLSSYLISNRGNSHFKYIKMLQSFFFILHSSNKILFKYSGNNILYIY